MVALNMSIKLELSVDLASVFQELARMVHASTRMYYLGLSIIRTMVRAALPQELQPKAVLCSYLNSR
jgi:hypothetical protein